MQNDDIQEQFNSAVAAGDYRLAERSALIWLLRLQYDVKVVPAIKASHNTFCKSGHIAPHGS
jgi:hypothetical protein